MQFNVYKVKVVTLPVTPMVSRNHTHIHVRARARNMDSLRLYDGCYLIQADLKTDSSYAENQQNYIMQCFCASLEQI